MNTDFRISVTCARHPKIRMLIRRLGHEAFYSLACLWSFTAAHKPSGDLSGMTAEEVELAAEWGGEPDALIHALVDLRLLDVDESGGYSVHDWREHNGYAYFADARTEKAKKAASARWDKNKQENERLMLDDTPSNAPSINEHMLYTAPSNAPTPAPTPAPIPTPAPYSGTEYCAEPPQAADAAPPEEPTEPAAALLTFPLAKNGDTYPVTQKDVDEWSESFPGIDVMQELRNCLQWNRDNPTRRKTKTGIRKHISGWLAKEQNRCQGDRASPNPQAPKPQYPQRMTPQQAYMKELGNYLKGQGYGNSFRQTDDITRTDAAPRALPGSGP